MLGMGKFGSDRRSSGGGLIGQTRDNMYDIGGMSPGSSSSQEFNIIRVK
jgi:hypothetical protein